MKKRPVILILILTLLLNLSGCSLYGGEIIELFRPPRLDNEQQAVLDALHTSVNTEFTLKHPRTGNNRSSVVFTDMDGDNKNEAVAFFTLKGMATVRIQFFDSIDGQWTPSTSVDADCSEVYQYEFADINGDGDYELVVGWDISLSDSLTANSSISTRRLSIYDFSQDGYKQIYTTPYSYMLTVNLNSDSADEIAVIATEALDSAAEESPLINKLFLIRSSNSVINTSASVELFSGVSAYSNFIGGKIGDGTPAIFLDVKLNTGEYITQVLQLNGDTLSRLFPDITVNPTRRNLPIYCMDIDQDTITEFPVCSPLPDYSTVSPTIRYLTDWCTYEKGIFTTSLSSIIGLSYDFYITISGENRSHITAEIIPEESLYVIKYANGRLTGTPLFYIKRFTETNGADVAAEGYTILFETEGYIIAAKLSENNYNGRMFSMDDILTSVHPIARS